MAMLYAIGDSFTYGFNFKVEQERLESVWPTHLASLLSLPHKNLAIPGSSNWRMARLVATLPLTQDDIVILALSDNQRFEFGVNLNHKPPAPKLPGDINEVDGNLITKRFFGALSNRTVDEKAKALTDLTFGPFFNMKWFEQMHIVMCSAITHRLQAVGCRWLMFDAWTMNPRIDVPNYIFPTSTMYDNVVQREKDHLVRYWTKEEHAQIANIIYDKLNNNQSNEYEIYSANTNLDWYY